MPHGGKRCLTVASVVQVFYISVMKELLFAALMALFAFVPASAADQSAPVVVIGKADAPITIDDYASLGCPHCANFQLTTLPQIKKVYIDTGKVKFIFHHFPLDKASVDAALLVQCVSPLQAEQTINLLYREQANWARDEKYDDRLVGYGAMLGISETTARACLNDTKMRDAILQGRVDANTKFQINATPTFVFNGGTARLEGDQSFDQMAAVINKM